MVTLERRRGSGAGLPTMNHQKDSCGSVDSSEDESPLSASHDWGSPLRNHRDQGLHHRHVSRPNPDQSGFHRRGTFSRGLKRRRKRYPCVRWLRSCILAGIPAYLLLIFLFLKRLNHQHSLLHHETHGIPGSGNTATLFRKLHATLNGALQRRLRDDNDQWESYSKVQKSTSLSFEQRRAKIRPPNIRPHSDPTIPSFLYSPADTTERPETIHTSEKLRKALIRSATEKELCGAFAQTASHNHPGAYTYRDALRMPKSRVTRVLITGILNQVAYILALALKERCNVQVVIGFDLMFPNSLRNRLRLQEQMALLTKSIPKLVRPIFLSYMGIDPMKHPKNFKVLESTKEVDIIQTLSPTHIVHLGSYDRSALENPDPEWRNTHSPYPRDGYNPSLYAVQSGALSMEQILASIANAPENDRPHFIYAGTVATAQSRRDQVLADFYYQQHGVYSVGVQLPSGIYGPWGHPNSPLYRLFASVVSHNSTPSSLDKLDLLHAEDVVNGITSAMQYRAESGKPVLFRFDGESVAANDLMDGTLTPAMQGLSMRKLPRSRFASTQAAIGWEAKIPLEQGLLRTLAWHMDRARPYGFPVNATTPAIATGDALLQRYSLPTCSPEDLVCHLGRPVLPCASECSIHHQCTKTIFDGLQSTVRDLTEECDIVLYTQDFDAETDSLALQSEYVEEDTPQICNLAFVHSKSKLVDTSIAKVPNGELEKLGVQIEHTPDGDDTVDAQKREKLNGRLLYRGWILVWADAAVDLSSQEEFLLKLSPGKLFHSDVKSAVFIDQDFGVSPKADDILFLVHEMHRKSSEARVVKRKTRPKAKFLLPAEPERKAIVLMSELKYQDTNTAERLSPDERISVYEATRFMRFSNGESPLGREPADIKLQREFYDRLRASINPDLGRRPDEPVHKFELRHWSRSRWVAHDLEHEEARQLRCEWYQEHSLWETPLDQLTFAYVMEKTVVNRKLENSEPDDAVQKQLAEKTSMKKLLSDTFEWHALDTEQNKLYSPYDEMRQLPYEMDYDAEAHPKSEFDGQKEPLLFVRVISDRIMAYARKAWNNGIKHAHVSDGMGEL